MEDHGINGGSGASYWSCVRGYMRGQNSKLMDKMYFNPTAPCVLRTKASYDQDCLNAGKPLEAFRTQAAVPKQRLQELKILRRDACRGVSGTSSFERLPYWDFSRMIFLDCFHSGAGVMRDTFKMMKGDRPPGNGVDDVPRIVAHDANHEQTKKWFLKESTLGKLRKF